MAYIANQYNYCTPLQSAPYLTQATAAVDDKKYFALFDNKLDGTYFPVSGNVGLWGNSVAASDGTLSSPFVVTVTEPLTISALSVVGSSYCYPVDFTLELYNSSTLLYTHSIAGNNRPSMICLLPQAYTITHYVISITKLSASGVARLYSAYQSWYMRSADSVKFSCRDTSSTGVIVHSVDATLISMHSSRDFSSRTLTRDTLRVRESNLSSILNTIDTRRDTLRMRFNEASHILNRIDKTRDSLRIAVHEGISHVINTSVSRDSLTCACSSIISSNASLVNIHSVMKAPMRQIFGKVYITYTDPLLNGELLSIATSGEAYNSSSSQVTDGVASSDTLFFTLYDNNLSGDYSVSSDTSQVGWTSDVISDASGVFSTPPYILIKFSSRPLVAFDIHFDSMHGSLATDFVVEVSSADTSFKRKAFYDNTQDHVTVDFGSAIPDAVSIKVSISRVTKPYSPVSIIDVPTTSRFLYTGYADRSNLVSMNVLEELTYDDSVEALGGISANEVTVTLDNSDRMFNFNNFMSPIARHLRRNRKIEPYLGAEVTPGEIEWHQLGTYWSYSWDVPTDSLTATVVGFDTLGLLDVTSFVNHTVQIDKSLGELIDYVLSDAKATLPFLEWTIAEELYEWHVPYAWFSKGSHTAALRKISQAYPMHIYCNRLGQIVAVPQKLKLDFYYDSWSDSTNVIDKNYSSLYATLPNLVNVNVIGPTLKESDALITDNMQFNVTSMPSRTLNFSAPYISDIVVSIDCDSSVSYTFNVYSWGIIINFSGTGNVRSIKCTGTSLDTSNTSVITRRDENSILINGLVTRDVSSDFIQDSSLASYILNRIFELSADDKYDVEVTYRGDIALTINDPILLLDGIAPSNKYNIKRHQLTWDGSLTGTAYLNT